MPAIAVATSYRFTATTTAQEFTVPSERQVVIVHRSVAEDGTTASLGALHVDTMGGVPVATNAPGEGLHTIFAGQSYSLIIPYGTNSFQIRAATASTLIQIILGGKTNRF